MRPRDFASQAALSQSALSVPPSCYATMDMSRPYLERERQPFESAEVHNLSGLIRNGVLEHVALRVHGVGIVIHQACRRTWCSMSRLSKGLCIMYVARGLDLGCKPDNLATKVLNRVSPNDAHNMVRRVLLLLEPWVEI